MRLFCQCMVLLMVLVNFFRCTYFDFNGSHGRKPLGFNGFIVTCIAIGLQALTVYGAGAFDMIFGGSK